MFEFYFLAQNGRNTPHSRLRYDVNLDIPGTEECKPLVMTLNQAQTTSPTIEQDNISILDRYIIKILTNTYVSSFVYVLKAI